MEAIIKHFENLIPQLGYSSLVWKQAKVVLNELNREATILAQNEFWYLYPQSVVEGIELFADNDYIITDATTTAEPNTLIKPLTGTIEISIPANRRQVLLFIQVIPTK